MHLKIIALSTLSLVLVCLGCNKKNNYQSYIGQTMGTSFSVKYSGQIKSDISDNIDKLLVEINQSVSTYIPNSTISVINTDSLAAVAYREGQDSILVYSLPLDTHFIKNFSISKKYHNDSYGFFDPAVMPLVNYWGFGYTDKKAIEKVDSLEVNKLLLLADFSKWLLSEDSIRMIVRKPLGSQIDFSAVAKGYAVDKIATLLDTYGIKDYMVEIGGEVKTKGKNPRGKLWTIGLSKPELEAAVNEFKGLVELDQAALASSGNYRNYHKVNGKIYGHEINPNTGYPELNRVLGTSVIAENCADADALATAFMVMGLEKSIDWLESQDKIKAVLFYQGDGDEIESYMSPGIPIKILE